MSQSTWSKWEDEAILTTAREYPKESLAFIASMAASRIGRSPGSVEARLYRLRKLGLLPERPCVSRQTPVVAAMQAPVQGLGEIALTVPVQFFISLRAGRAVLEAGRQTIPA
jgi:hypothetical protein